MTTYINIAVCLIIAELLYFRIADHFNIIDKPNERSSHSRIVLRGGGVIFTIALWIWSIWYGFPYPWLLAGVTLAAGVSFVDDVHSLPDLLRLVVQFVSMFLVFQEIGLFKLIIVNGQLTIDWHWQILVLFVAMITAVGATNIINFMDGINGITAGYALAVLVPLIIKNEELRIKSGTGFVEQSYLVVAILGVLVFCLFNFRPKGKARCFAGDVGSIGIAFIMLFAIGRLILQSGDLTYLILLLIYGVDGCLTICHRIMLHENLGEAHRKHVYQLMANELKIGHVKVSLLYMGMQLIVSLGFIYLCPDTVSAHWWYFIAMCVVFGLGYVLFKKKYYHLHEEYLQQLKDKN